MYEEELTGSHQRLTPLPASVSGAGVPSGRCMGPQCSPDSQVSLSQGGVPGVWLMQTTSPGAYLFSLPPTLPDPTRMLSTQWGLWETRDVWARSQAGDGLGLGLHPLEKTLASCSPCLRPLTGGSELGWPAAAQDASHSLSFFIGGMGLYVSLAWASRPRSCPKPVASNCPWRHPRPCPEWNH